MGVDDVAQVADEFVVALVLFVAQAHTAVLHVHQGEFHAHQGDALDHDLAAKEWRRGKIDRGLGRARHDPAVTVIEPRAQHHQIHPALVPAPFDGGLVIVQRNARQGFMDRTRECAPQRAQRHRAPQQPKPRADHEKHDGRHQRAHNQAGVAHVMGLDKSGEGQFHVGFLLRPTALLRRFRPKKGKFFSPLDSSVSLRRPHPMRLNPLRWKGLEIV